MKLIKDIGSGCCTVSRNLLALSLLLVMSAVFAPKAHAFPVNGGYVCTNASPECEICIGDCGSETARWACNEMGYGSAAVIRGDIENYEMCTSVAQPTGGCQDVQWDTDGFTNGRPMCNNFNITEKLCGNAGLTTDKCDLSNVQYLTNTGAVCNVTGRACPKATAPVVVPPSTPSGPVCGMCSTAEEVTTENCPCGQEGVIIKKRTANNGGVCGVFSEWAVTSNTCKPIVSATNMVSAIWQRLPEDGVYDGPGGHMINNCPAGYTPTEFRDDGDSGHSLSEDNSHGGTYQLCIKASTNNSAVMTSTWAAGSCPADMIDTGVSDSYGGNMSKSSKYYIYKHYMDEEESTSAYWHWCLGVNAPNVLEVRKSMTASCNADETLLVTAHGNEWNVNNEDGKINRALCVKVTSPANPSSCSTPTTPASGGGDGSAANPLSTASCNASSGVAALQGRGTNAPKWKYICSCSDFHAWINPGSIRPQIECYI